MKIPIIILATVIFVQTNLYAQRGEHTFTVMFYNVENLFDTINHPDFDDEEFTPAGSKQWDYGRYGKKLEDIARVILSVPEKELPALIGFAEVENQSVLEDLVQQRGLRREEYKAIVIDTDDPRGIDCGLIYRTDLFKYRTHRMLPVEDLSGNDYPLRGILHVEGTGPDGAPLHIYINHWKSRRGGVKETEHLRVYAGIAMRRELDRLLSTSTDPRAIVMGDFNDEPTNKSIFDVLHAANKRMNIAINDAYNLFYDIHNMGLGGSYNYQGTWQMYDQIIVSYSLLNQSRGLSTTFDGGKILKEEWMLYHDERNDVKVPNRTYGGDNYYGGISDHFPLYVTFSY
ncbi:MAG: endonuclease [Bacteroidales bacterium]|nr:endonuclease [Bacteroidales bacterium]MDT8432491.1 endonuclease [Bacteroidales bacterium]